MHDCSALNAHWARLLCQKETRSWQFFNNTFKFHKKYQSNLTSHIKKCKCPTFLRAVRCFYVENHESAQLSYASKGMSVLPNSHSHNYHRMCIRYQLQRYTQYELWCLLDVIFFFFLVEKYFQCAVNWVKRPLSCA